MLLHTVVAAAAAVVVVVAVLKQKNGQIGGVYVFFEESRSKKHRKYRVFYASQAQNHGIYGVFCSW